MEANDKRVRVLYSFPHKLGADRICYTAWEQVNGLLEAGAEVFVCPGSLHKALRHSATIQPTLAWGKLRIPYKAVGTITACKIHDRIVAKRLRRMAGQVDIVHSWPLGAEETLRVAAEMGVPSVLERPNAHTGFAYDVVRAECARIGVELPKHHEHAFNHNILSRELREYRLAHKLLCPSEFTAKSFRDRGFGDEQLARHIYGYDEALYHPGSDRASRQRFTVLFVGVCAVRKGLHFALEAWLRSPAHQTGRFLVAGEFLPAYAKRLAPLLAHPSIEVLGHRKDVSELMRNSDVLVLPTIEEGFGLVCVEAMGSGCVPVVSEACTDTCKHMQNSLVHAIGDVGALTEHLTMLYRDRELLERLRMGSLQTAPLVTWRAAGVHLLNVYRAIISRYNTESTRQSRSITGISQVVGRGACHAI